MRSTHHFTPVWHSEYALQTLRAETYSSKKKRKVTEVDDEHNDEYHDDLERVNDRPSALKARRLSQSASRSEAAKSPHHVAGLAEYHSVPLAPYPHAPVRSKNPGPRARDLQDELASLKPPLYEPPAQVDDRGDSLKRQHLEVLTSIVHTNLLKGDFVRAGRAWGMILRSERDGRPFDLKSYGRWAIGAEILLRRDSHIVASQHTPDRADSSIDGITRTENAVQDAPSAEGFQVAKDYYERLILQYPYTREHAKTINSLSFYPAMFGLWIYEASETSRCALARLVKDAYDADNDVSADDRPYDDDQREEVLAVKRTELESAQQIMARLDELLIAPPWDRYMPLVQLRGMVGLWLSDLYMSFAVSPQDQSDKRVQEAAGERKTARKYFQKVSDDGGNLPESVVHLVTK